jgi:hypothetical protein
MRYGVALLVAALLIMGCMSSNASAQSSSSWVNEPLKVVGDVQVPRLYPAEITCTGTNSRVQMVGEDVFRAACVFGVGSKPRVARLVNFAGQYEYAISFAHERNFYPIKYLCLELDYCVYSQSEDVLFQKALLANGTYTYRLIRNFSKQIQRVEGAEVSYQAQGLEGELFLDGATMTTIGLSSNGRWAAIEVEDKGIVRLDIRTGQIAWITSLVITDFRPQPVKAVAVSNDGRWIGVTGWRQGLTVYEVTEPCGQAVPFTQVTQWCRASSIVRSELLPGYASAYRPAFSTDGMRLSFILLRAQGFSRVTVVPASRVDAQAARYIAFGDSYTSGEGELADSFYLTETNSATNRCHVSSRSYPLLLSHIWDMPALNMACSGSRIPDVRDRVSQLTDSNPLLVSLGVGGNDIDLIGKLKSCLGPGTCEWARDGMRLSTVQEMKRILPDLVQLIEEVRQSTGATVFVVGYPSIISLNDPQCDAVTANLLSLEEREYIEESLQYLNTIVQSAARYAGVTFVDISQAFVGERLCEGTQKAMNAVRLGDDIAPLEFLKKLKFIGAESFHPTPFGHQRTADTIQASYGAFWLAQGCEACTPSVDYSPYWTQGGLGLTIAVTQIVGNFLGGEDFTSGMQTPFSFEPGTFSPDTTVKVEIRSDAQVLGEYTASEDGSLNGVVTVPNDLTGSHTIHSIGTSPSGETIDMYENVFIEPPKESQGVQSGGASGAQGEVSISTTSLHAHATADQAHTAGPEVVATGSGMAQQNSNKTANEPAVRGSQAAATSLSRAPYPFNPLLFLLIGVGVVLLILIILLLYRRKV